MNRNYVYKLIENKNGKVVVRQAGNPCFDYIINTKTLSCPCSNDICIHIQFYLSCKHISKSIMPYLKVPFIKNKIRALERNDIINQICYDFLHSEEHTCPICIESFLSPVQSIPVYYDTIFHICKICNNIFHLKCFLDWNKGCPICKKGHPELNKNQYGHIEDFPALI